MKSVSSASGLVALLSILVLYIMLGPKLFSPNDYVYAFGGDAAIIYFNMIYHCLYGSGLQLSNMNYPIGESLLMTDAQASISYLLSVFSSNDFLRDNVVGIAHSFHYLCIVLATVFMHKTFRKLGVNSWISIVGALLVVFLSPQLFRLRAGHFGLAYPIIFSGALYSLVSYHYKPHWKYGLLLSSLLIFFGLNNIYLLVLAVGLSTFYILSDYWVHKDKVIFGLLPFVLIPFLLVFVLVKTSSPEMDRLAIQWGYYPNRIRFKGLFYPFTSLLGGLFGEVKKNIENACALGLVNTIMVLGLFISLIVSKLRNRPFRFFKKYGPLAPLLISSLIVLIYATGALKPLAEAIPAATMFKASGRFAWPFFYCFSVISIVALNHIWEGGAKKQKSWKIIVIISLMVWGIEDYNYLKNVIKFKQYGNLYSPKELKKINNDLEANQIDVHQFQALYALPTMEAWNDKFHLKIPYNTEFNATRLSMATGLPMINAMLSRIGLTQAGQAIQLASHPWIKRELLEKLDHRPILLLLGKESKLTLGEQYLMGLSELLMDQKSYALYRLDPSDLKQMELPKCKAGTGSYFFEAYNNHESSLSLEGAGAKHISEVEILFSQGGLKETKVFGSNKINASIYVLATAKKYGLPWMKATQFDDKGNKVGEQHFDIASSKDLIKNWRRAEMQIEIKEESDSLEILLHRMNQSFLIDNFLLHNAMDTVCHSANADSTSYWVNNFLIGQ